MGLKTWAQDMIPQNPPGEYKNILYINCTNLFLDHSPGAIGNKREREREKKKWDLTKSCFCTTKKSMNKMKNNLQNG